MLAKSKRLADVLNEWHDSGCDIGRLECSASQNIKAIFMRANQQRYFNVRRLVSACGFDYLPITSNIILTRSFLRESSCTYASILVIASIVN